MEESAHIELSTNVLKYFPFCSTTCQTLTAQEVRQRPRRALIRKRYRKDRETSPQRKKVPWGLRRMEIY